MENCPKCTSPNECVCELLIYYGNCPTCLNRHGKCLCKELATSQSRQPLSQRVDPVVDQLKQMLKAFAEQTPAVPPPAMSLVIPPVVKDLAKWQLQHFWKEACKAENVNFTRKEHCAYPRVLATYKRLRREYDELCAKNDRERSSGW